MQVEVPDAEDPDEGAAAEQKRKGDVAFVGRQYQEALQAYSQSLRHQTSNHVVWANRSAVYLRLNNAQAALEDARRARKLDETYTKVMSERNAYCSSVQQTQIEDVFPPCPYWPSLGLGQLLLMWSKT